MKISHQRFAELCRQFAALLDAGLPTVRSLQTLADAVPEPERTAMLAMKASIEEGSTFSEAAARRSELFDDYALALIRAGEHSGDLVSVLKEMAEYSDQMHQFRRQVLSRLAYPVLLLHVAICVAAIVRIFDADGGLAAAGWTIISILVPIYAMVIGGFWLFRISKGHATLRMTLDNILYHTPGIGDIIYHVGMSRLCGCFAALYDAGVTMSTAMPLAAHATGNAVLRHRLAPAVIALAEGSAPTKALRATGLMDEIELGMLFTGQEAGKLDEALRRLADKHSEGASNAIARLSFIIPGVIYFAVAAYIIFLIFKMFGRYVNALNSF